MPRTCAVCRSLTSDQPGLRPPGSDALKEDFINGATGVVTAVHIAPDGITPTVIYFRPDGAAADVRVVPKRTACKVYGLGEVDRHQFPLVPAHCVTVHRVQGATVEGALHVLLNAEFFAYGARTRLPARALIPSKATRRCR